MQSVAVSSCGFNGLSDEEIVFKAREGNSDAWEYIVAKYIGLVKRKARTYFLVGAEPDDILQEGMIGLCKAVRDFKGSKLSSFKTFADVCITRQMITAIKTATRQKHMPLNEYVSFNTNVSSDDGDNLLIDFLKESYDYDPERIVIDKENLAGIELKIGEALSKFEICVLIHYLKGESYNEISKVLSKNPKSIDNALQRIRRKLEAVVSDKK